MDLATLVVAIWGVLVVTHMLWYGRRGRQWGRKQKSTTHQNTKRIEG